MIKFYKTFFIFPNLYIYVYYLKNVLKMFMITFPRGLLFDIVFCLVFIFSILLIYL